MHLIELKLSELEEAEKGLNSLDADDLQAALQEQEQGLIEFIFENKDDVHEVSLMQLL